MVDTSQIYITEIVSTPLKKVANTGGGEYAGPCPFCGGKDRFYVQAGKNRWFCRYCKPGGGDVIDYIQTRDACDFKTALKTLGLKSDYIRPRFRQEPPPPVVNDTKRGRGSESEAWQCAAERFYRERQDRGNQSPASEYLASRGLSKVVCVCRVGWNPKPYKAFWGDTEVFLPTGVVMPWHDGQKYTAMRVRPLEGEQRYWQAAGMQNSLYLGGPFALDIDPDEVVVLVEGEIDAMSIRAAVQDEFESWPLDLIPETRLPYRGVALGGTQGGRTLASVAKLATAKQVIVATDADPAGDEAAAWWLDQIPGSVRARPAGAKDMNELLTRYGWSAIIALLEGVGSYA